MINFDKHLREVLYEYDFIVIPNLGAFIANFEVQENNGESKPFKTFSFNQLLNIDDNQKFFNYLLRVENKPISEIEIQWNNYLLNLRNELNKNKRFEVDGLGSVIASSENEISFKFLEKSNFYERDLFESNAVFMAPSLKPVEIQPEVELKEETVDPTAKSTSEEEIEIGTTLNEPIGQNSNFLEQEEYQENEFFEEEKSSFDWKKIIWLILILLLAALAYYFWNENSKNNVNDDVAVDDSAALIADSLQTIQIEDSLAFEGADSMQSSTIAVNKEEVKEPKVEEKETNPIVKTQPKARFHVWAGLFKSKSNANNLLEKLKKGGLNAKIQMVKDMRRVYVPVRTEAQAKNTVKKIEQLTGEKAVYFEVD